MKINLVMIVKNEERCLRRCLRAAKSLVDEIIIADTGSSDRTKTIAKELGAAVGDFQWVDDFSAARNFALAHSDGDSGAGCGRVSEARKQKTAGEDS